MYRKYGKRLFDIFFSFIGLILLFPLLLLIYLLVLWSDGLPVFYCQERVGKGGKIFKLIKFRSMYKDADKKGLLTVGGRDPRVTPVGYYLRKYKLDELPQLWNVLVGDMSLVGPRPEVKKYVDMYNEDQRKILSIKPGITDRASIRFSNENEILAKYDNPEEGYVKEVMPKKLEMYLEYLNKVSLREDLGIIFDTIIRVTKSSKI
ncbi:MAG: sugar transferase [Bacteroidia bacterium]|nr:sugar transferase [Bacteroidia bacterium]